MSGYRPEQNRLAASSSGAATRRVALGPALNALRIALWAVLHFCFYFVQQVAELGAPILLVIGLGWWALPHVVGLITTQQTANPAGGDAGQMHDILNTLSGSIPPGLHFAGHWVTPGGLIFDGLALMALAALCSTLAAVVAREIR